jgi:hypothetical protein
MKQIGDKMLFSGGAEETPAVEVVRFKCPGSMHNGDSTLRIVQFQKGAAQVVELSPETMKAILKWFEEG